MFPRSRRSRLEMIGGRRTEEMLVFAILQTLNVMPNTFAWRMETRGIPRKTKTGWVVRTNPLERGKPDIAGCKNGKAFVMEVKMPGQKLKPHQAEWIAHYVGRSSGVAFVPHSVDEAAEMWKTI